MAAPLCKSMDNIEQRSEVSRRNELSSGVPTRAVQATAALRKHAMISRKTSHLTE